MTPITLLVASPRSRLLTRFLLYRFKQQAEALALALDLLSGQCIRFRTQAVDDDFPAFSQIDWVDYAAERSMCVLLTPFPVMIVEEAV